MVSKRQTKQQLADIYNESPTAWKQLQIRRICQDRSETYWKAIQTGSTLDWLKYVEMTESLDRLTARDKRTRKGA